MINATLCTTNSQEPWAANIDFDVQGAIWTTKLATKYTHYKNLLKNTNAVINYKTSDIELLMKAQLASTINAESIEEYVQVSFTVIWLRLVDHNDVLDVEGDAEIARIVKSKIR